jgi:hypothetical protein
MRTQRELEQEATRQLRESKIRRDEERETRSIKIAFCVLVTLLVVYFMVVMIFDLLSPIFR